MKIALEIYYGICKFRIIVFVLCLQVNLYKHIHIYSLLFLGVLSCTPVLPLSNACVKQYEEVILSYNLTCDTDGIEQIWLDPGHNIIARNGQVFDNQKYAISGDNNLVLRQVASGMAGEYRLQLSGLLNGNVSYAVHVIVIGKYFLKFEAKQTVIFQFWDNFCIVIKHN